MSESMNQLAATSNGFVAAPEPKFASVTMQNFSRNWEGNQIALAKKNTISIRNLLGTAGEKPVGAGSTSDMARSGNAPNFFKQCASGAVVIDVNRHISRNYKQPQYNTQSWTRNGESTKASRQALGKSHSSISISGTTAAKANDYMTIQNKLGFDTPNDAPYRRLMSAANLGQKFESGHQSNRVVLLGGQMDPANAAAKVTIDQFSNDETPYKMGRTESASLERERPTASRDSLRRKTFYGAQTNTESRAELRAIQENSNAANDFTDSAPRTKRMKSAATVKKQGRLVRVGSEGNLTRNNWMSKKTADATSTHQSTRDLTGPYKGISFRDFAEEYPQRQQQFDFHIQGLKVPKTNGKECQFYVEYHEENEKYSKNFMNQVIRRAQAQPDQFKNDLLKHKKWTDGDRGTGAWSKNYMNSNSQHRKTALQQHFEDAKGKPGPTHYKAEKVHKWLTKIPGTYLTTVKEGNAKFTITESEAFVKKTIPGPQHKYKINYDFVKDRTPFYADISKSLGREKDNAKPKKDRGGPGYYFTEKAVDKNVLRKSTSVIFSGFGAQESAKDNIKHADKLKVKTVRHYDNVIKRAKFGPGVGHYKGVENGLDKKAGLPRSLAAKRH